MGGEAGGPEGDIGELEKLGLVEKRGDSYRLTPQGILQAYQEIAEDPDLLDYLVAEVYSMTRSHRATLFALLHVTYVILYNMDSEEAKTRAYSLITEIENLPQSN